MIAALLSALMLQDAAAGGQVVWSTPAPAEAPVAAAAPPIPDWARADPYGYERSECSPLIRSKDETLEACQSRVRTALAANLGDALPAGLRPADVARNCRQEQTGDGYDMQCSTPVRMSGATGAPQERVCETRPQAQPRGGVAWSEECRPATGERERDEGLRIRLGGDDD
jgi:hypothetical protein